VGETFCVFVYYMALSFFMHAISYNLFSSSGARRRIVIKAQLPSHTARVLFSSLFYGAKVSIYQPKFATATILQERALKQNYSAANGLIVAIHHIRQ
jgi:hypothetical protein